VDGFALNDPTSPLGVGGELSGAFGRAGGPGEDRPRLGPGPDPIGGVRLDGPPDSVPMELLGPGLRVTNLERSLRFYTKTLGLREVRRGDTRSWGGGLWVQLEDPKSRQRVELNWYPRGSIFHGPFRSGDALDHLDFDLGAVPVATLERTYRRLVRGGARPTRYTAATTAGWMASAIDPNGIWIVLTRRPTAAQRRAMERVDAEEPSQVRAPRRRSTPAKT